MENKSFEESLLKLEDIIRELEKGEVPLEEMVKKYTEAMDYVKFCSKKLDEATKTVNKIMNEDGTLSEFNPKED